jgi:predicted O-methyltransferase YrrM
MNLRTFRPRYLARRIDQAAFVKSHPNTPWITRNAIYLLDNWLRPTDRGLEWGSGRSTIWYAQHCKHVTSVEHNGEWHKIVVSKLRDANVADRVDYRFIACELAEHAEPESHPYADVAREFPDESFDWILVDGMIRATCMRLAIPKLKSGGLLILDNANRYVPNKFQHSHTTVHEPRSENRSERWAQLLQSISSWRAMNTSDGIWDTRFWIKP